MLISAEDPTQYQFPPSVWDAGDWSVDEYTAVWGCLLIVMIFFAARKPHSRRACGVRAGVTAFLCMHWVNLRPFLEDSMRPILLSNFCLIGRFVKEDIDPDVLASLLTVDGGEPAVDW